jgi:hypothetical protein
LFHARRPNLPIPFRATQLTCENGIKRIDLFLSPLYARTHEQRWEAGLKGRDRVPYNREVHKGHGPDVLLEVTFKDALSETVSTTLSQAGYRPTSIFGV